MYSFSDYPSTYLPYAPRSSPPPPPRVAPPPPCLVRSTSPPSLSPPTWNHASAVPRSRTRRSSEEEVDEDANVDTSNMTQEEKNEFKAQRKLKKMNIEKVKRCRVNEQFDHLCRVLHVDKSTRVEKLTVLNETLRALHQLKAENKLLKEQTSQMKELVTRKHNGESIATLCNLHAPTPPQDIKSCDLPMASPQLSSKRSLTRGSRSKAAPPPPPPPPSFLPAEPSMDFSMKEQMFYDPSFSTPKQDIMSFGKQDLLSQKHMTLEASWSTMFAQPQENDLDFAFGDSSFTWMSPRQQDNVLAFPPESECDFNSFALSPPEHDNMDLFFMSSDDCDLLC